MTTDDAADWLVQEISDLLDAGPVGLYEFMDEQNDSEDLRLGPLDERKAIASAALQRLLMTGGIEIQRRKWAQVDDLGTVSPEDLPADPWDRPDEGGNYLAIARV